jgi:hypothetical protein
MPEGRHEQPIRVAGIDGDLRNLLGVSKTEVRPRLAGVRSDLYMPSPTARSGRGRPSPEPT